MSILNHHQTILIYGDPFLDRYHPFPAWEFFGLWKPDEKEQVSSLMRKRMSEFVSAKFNHWSLHYSSEDNLYVARQTAYDDLYVTGRGFIDFMTKMKRCLKGNHPERKW